MPGSSVALPDGTEVRRAQLKKGVLPKRAAHLNAIKFITSNNELHPCIPLSKRVDPLRDLWITSAPE